MDIRNKILSAQDIKKESLTLGEPYNVTVEIRGMSGKLRAEAKLGAIETKQVRDEKTGEVSDVQVTNEAKLHAAIVIASTFDPTTGQQVFSPADRDLLLEKSASMLDEIMVVAGRVGGFSVEAQKEIEKNSDATPNAATSSI